MSENKNAYPEPVDLPGEVLLEVAVHRQRWPSPIWLIPLMAALIGGWLLFQYWFQQGEVITVSFPSAEGIEPGSTQVRYKAVTVGKVKSVTLDANLNPLVTLALSKDISEALDCSAQFWVVRPRVRGAEISGLGTLFSGTYVGMTPVAQQQGKSPAPATMICYQVLETPPINKPSRPGRELTLLTDTMGSVDIGTPIFYKKLQVGEIYNYRLSAATGKVELGVFIDDPYYRFITSSTRFWSVSGVDFKVDSTGAEFHMESVSSLLIGGVAFDTPRDQPANLPVAAPGAVFELYESYAKSREKRYEDRIYYTLYFNGSLRGLSESAPVEYKGIRVGQVEKIKMHLDAKSLDMRIPVLISIEPQRFSEDIQLADAPRLMEDMVNRGMRAKLQTGSLLTGQMYVSLNFEENVKPEPIAKGQFYDVFPTSPTPVEELSRMASGIADDVKATLGSVRRFMESDQLDKTVNNVNQVLMETEATIKEARKAVEEARTLMQALNETTLPTVNRSVTQVTGTLNHSLISVTDNVERVTGTLNRSLTSVTGNVDKVTGTLNRSLTSVTGNVDKVTGTLNRSLTEVTNDVNKATGTLNRSLVSATGNLDKVTGTVNNSLTRVTGSVEQAGNNVARNSVELNKTMQRLQNSLTHLDRLLAQNSPTQYQLMEMMKEVTSVSKSIQALTDSLKRQPESLLRGRQE